MGAYGPRSTAEGGGLMGTVRQLPTPATRRHVLHRAQITAAALLLELLEDEREQFRPQGPGLLLLILILRIVKRWAAFRL